MAKCAGICYYSRWSGDCVKPRNLPTTGSLSTRPAQAIAGNATNPFIIVRPELVRRVGAAGALIVASVEFRCEIAGVDRIEDETGRWWRVTQVALAADTGLSRDAVKRELRKLLDAQELEAFRHHTNGVSDQTTSYRKRPQPSIVRNRPMDSAELHNGRSDQVRNRPIECAIPRNHHWAESPNVPLIEELQEGVAPPVRCSNHIDHPTTDPCRACGDARRERERWDLRQATVAKVAISTRARHRAELLAESIDRCGLCDDRGYFGTIVCDHNPDRIAINQRGAARVRAALGERPDRSGQGFQKVLAKTPR